MSRAARAFIDLGALRYNLQQVRRCAPASRTVAVIKANAYGHGLLPAARVLVDGGADALAVTCLNEAVPLREAGIASPILLLQGPYEAADLAQIARHHFDIVVHSQWQIDLLERCRPAAATTVWLKVDSGMHRLGFAPEAVQPAYQRLQASPAVGSIRLLTHLAAADDRDNAYTPGQVQCFERSCAGLAGERSIANSAAVLAWPATHSDWVRPGIMLYGVSPFADGRPAPVELKPVMTLTSRLIAKQVFGRGEAIGYGGAYVCPESMCVGVVTLGYGDGYPRHATTGTPILVNGQRTQLLGRVSMDMLTVDLRGLEDVPVDAPVTLWGEGLPIEEVAQASGTIGYELLCKLTARVSFEYRDLYHGQG